VKVSAFGECTLIIYFAISSRGGTFFQTPAIERFHRSSGHVIVAALDYFKRHEAAAGVECYSRDYLCSPPRRERAFTFLIDDFVLLPLVPQEAESISFDQSSPAALHLIRHLHNRHLTVPCAPSKVAAFV
jgi:hypothetical protein